MPFSYNETSHCGLPTSVRLLESCHGRSLRDLVAFKTDGTAAANKPGSDHLLYTVELAKDLSRTPKLRQMDDMPGW